MSFKGRREVAGLLSARLNADRSCTTANTYMRKVPIRVCFWTSTYHAAVVSSSLTDLNRHASYREGLYSESISSYRPFLVLSRPRRMRRISHPRREFSRLTRSRWKSFFLTSLRVSRILWKRASRLLSDCPNSPPPTTHRPSNDPGTVHVTNANPARKASSLLDGESTCPCLLLPRPSHF